MAPETTSRTPTTKASRAPSSFPSLRSLSSAERHAQFAESAKLEHVSTEASAKVEAIKANLRGLGYGG
jgi:hypothetical protein